MTAVSVTVITLNEEASLARALASVASIADEIVVVDAGSSDGTEAIARQHGAKFIHRDWTSYAEQKNFAAQNTANEWILSLDADEELSAQLQSSLLEWKRKPADFSVYEVARRAWYLGAWVRHSGWYPDFQRRLYRRGAAQFSGTVHEALRFSGPPGRLAGDLLHYTIDSFAEHEAKVERYTTLAAQQMFDNGRRTWRSAQLFGVPWSWLQNYFLRGGCLDGYRGALIAQMAARSVRLKYGKLGELVREEAARRKANER